MFYIPRLPIVKLHILKKKNQSTVQMGTQISNNLSTYLQEHEIDLEIKENDAINLWQAL